MQRVCSIWKTLVRGDGAFCPSCGEPLPAAVQLEKTPQTTPMGASQQNDVMPSANSIPSYSQQNSYTAPPSAQINNYGQWVGTIILTTWFGIISLILCIVWGVSSDTPINKKRYCQAMIIIQAISLVVGIIFAIVFAVSMVGIGSSIADSVGSGYYYY